MSRLVQVPSLPPAAGRLRPHDDANIHANQRAPQHDVVHNPEPMKTWRKPMVLVLGLTMLLPCGCGPKNEKPGGGAPASVLDRIQSRGEMHVGYLVWEP